MTRPSLTPAQTRRAAEAKARCEAIRAVMISQTRIRRPAPSWWREYLATAIDCTT
jgi:hypothetical protein